MIFFFLFICFPTFILYLMSFHPLTCSHCEVLLQQLDKLHMVGSAFRSCWHYVFPRLPQPLLTGRVLQTWQSWWLCWTCSVSSLSFSCWGSQIIQGRLLHGILFVTEVQVKYNPLTTSLKVLLFCPLFLLLTYLEYNVLIWIQEYCKISCQNPCESQTSASVVLSSLDSVILS